jgi:hypothetical protein
VILGLNSIALTDREGAQFAELAEAMTQRVDLMPTGDRHQIGAIGEIGLIGTI